MALQIAINGFGRIGRNVLRLLSSGYGSQEVKVVAINDLTDAETLAHLLSYDSVHGRFSGTVSVAEGKLIVNGQPISITAEKDPSKLPWSMAKADLVLECSGVFTSKEKASAHLKSGARKVIISAPAKDVDVTVVMGVNHTMYNGGSHHIVSCASCTTNCLAPVAKVIHEQFGIEHGTMTTIHSYTNDQRILDLPHKDLRRARAAALSMIPTSTGAAKAIGLVLPALKGKLDGLAIRVPTADVSVVDLVVTLQKDATVEELNGTLKEAATGSLKGILNYTEEELVSVDYIGCLASSTVDAPLTMVMNKRQAKVVAWYDNEMGFSARMIDLAALVGAA